MANWTTPRTWVTGEVVTAALMNTHVRDNTTYLYENSARAPAARAARTTNQSIPNVNWTTVSFDTENFDTDTMYTAANPDVFTIKTAGLYLIVGGFTWQTNTTGMRGARIILNNSANSSVEDIRAPSPSAGEAAHTISYVAHLSVDDTIKLQARQASGAALLIDTSTPEPNAYLSVTMLNRVVV